MNFIDGKFVNAQSGACLDNINPATTRVIGQIPRSNADDVDLAVKAAWAAFPAWSTRPAEDRAAVLNRIASAIEDRLEDLAKLESEDTGKPLFVASTVDIPRAAKNFRFFAAQIQCDSTGFHQNGNESFNYTARQPVGVVGLITPWNLPLYLLTWKLAPALACGNCVVAKPSEMTPRTATLLCEILEECGVPKGVVNIVHGLGAECGNALVSHPRVKAISFTGGTATGKIVGQTAAGSFKKCSLELGGKNPTIIFADCDLEKALATSVRAAFSNQGQICLCGSRIFVQEGVYDQFIHDFVGMVEKMKPGDPADPATRMGALISQDHYKKVASYVDIAKSEGGTILCGGCRPKDLPAHCAEGAFLCPTVIVGLPDTARCVTEEIFGPVVTIHKFQTEEEVIERANSVEYGLAASVWTSNLNTAHRVSQKLESGMVWVNTWMLRDLRVPFGGVKSSGVGREGGLNSLDFFTEVKNVCIQL